MKSFVVVITMLSWSLSARADDPSFESVPVSGPAFQHHLMTQHWYGIEETLRTRPREQAALDHATKWRESADAPNPTAGREGRVVFRFGPSTKIICAQLRVCDIELEPGEVVQSLPHAGDDERWDITPIESGSAPKTTHIIVKPLAPNIETNVVIPTDRRVYHLELQSTEHERASYMPFVSFSYPDDTKARWSAYLRNTPAAAERPEGNRHDTDDLQVDLSSVNTGYEIHKRGRWLTRRAIKWMPVRAWDNGNKTIIEMPFSIAHRELPILLVCEDHQEDCNGDGDGKVVNFRVKGNRFVVDRLFENAVLIKAVGRRRQERVSINRVEEDQHD